MESLQGHFLIATSQMPDPRFKERVIYMCTHTDEGAMGLTVNQPVPNVTLADIFRSANLTVPDRSFPNVYMGGPVEMDTGFFLFSSEYEPKNFIRVTPTVSLSRDPEILREIWKGQGPEEFIFALGYAGWAAGQLEGELIMNGWLTLPAEDEVLFNTPDEFKWKKAADRFGIDIALFGDVIGTA
ncbi:MAG: YqgE/AlgH family protein [Desulfobulbaceae bacterium]|nr:YqgE/AlgH family protein [Desulfobulbaceae bacterium]MCK5322898.1 YqgE/AlgH family protein [Desulfobulbaceae bacterium]MCK5543579.1 YqgE/AlgH family protein [Desulfobulbaceae bacterium]